MQFFLEKITNGDINFFEKIEVEKDTFTKIIEGSIPSYHIYKDCNRMNQAFINYYIPQTTRTTLNYRSFLYFKNFENEIKLNFNEYKKKIYEEEKIKLNLSNNKIKQLLNNEEELKKYKNKLIRLKYERDINIFRKWFRKYEYLLNSGDKNQNKFNMLYKDRWNLINEFRDPEIYLNASGIEEAKRISNLNLRETELELDSKINEVKNYLNTLEKKKRITLEVLGKNFYFLNGLIKVTEIEKKGNEEYIEEGEKIFWTKVYNFHKVKNYYDNYNAEELYIFLKNYDEKYIQPIKLLLSNYITFKINPNLSINMGVLDNLGFKLCHECEQRKIINKK